MNNPFEIIKDSSVWFNPDSYSAADKRDPFIRIGLIKNVYLDKDLGDFRYHVEVQDKNDRIEATCRMMRRFGGVYNYEDITHRGYKTSDKTEPHDFKIKAGDLVIVAFISGESRDGIILGGLTHPARRISLDLKDGPQYQSEFNGVETVINKDGEYTVTFRGQPTNISSLKETPSKKIPAAQYDKEVGTSFMKFDKTGSWELNDNATSDKQFLRVDKKLGQVIFTAGKVSMVMNKKSEDTSLKTKTLNIDSTDKITETTKEYKMTASTFVKIKSPKVAIGTDGIELLDHIIKAIDKLGFVRPISPVGYCTALRETEQWVFVEEVKNKILQIKGTL